MRIRDVKRHRTGDRGGWEGSYVTPETAQAPFAIASLDAVLFDFISPKRLQSVDHALQGVARLDIEFVSDLADLDGPGCFEERGCTDFISDLVHFGELVCVSQGVNNLRCIADLRYVAPSRRDSNFYRCFVGHLKPNDGVAKPPPTAGIRCKDLRRCCNENCLLIACKSDHGDCIFNGGETLSCRAKVQISHAV